MRNFLITCIGTGVFLASCGNNNNNTSNQNPDEISLNNEYTLPENFDLQAHRVGRGIAPENSLFAIPIALDIPEVTTLEIDLAITRDKQVILSHEPWMSSGYCDHPNDDRIMPYEDEKIIIYNMDYAQIKEFRCGGRRDRNFPDQRLKYATKALLDTFFVETKRVCAEKNRELPHFNIEIKSDPEWDGFYTPKPAEFVSLTLEIIKKHGLEKQCTIQSFDPRSLEEVKKQAPQMRISLLGKEGANWNDDQKSLTFKPDIYSPYFTQISPSLVKELQDNQIQVIPYTVNDSLSMRRVIESGVNGLITDFPDKAAQIMGIYRK